MWESFAGAAAARQGILPSDSLSLSLPSERWQLPGHPCGKSFPATASAAGEQQLSAAKGGDGSREAPAPPAQRLLGLSGASSKSNKRTPWQRGAGSPGTQGPAIE